MTPRISYSIEAEDLLIQRLFDAVVFRDRGRVGRFLDIGAHHPIRDSNTYLFYRAGWRGLNVEPNPDFMAEFAQERPEDRTLNVGVSSRSEVLTYHRFNDSLVNGFLSNVDLAATVRNGYEHIGSCEIECIGICELVAEHVTFEVDLLNIDVEQSDYRVLQAWDWRLCRPKVICAEIHALTMQDVVSSPVSSVLNKAGYQPMSRGWQSCIFVDGQLL